MWAKLKKGVETMRAPAFRLPVDEWRKFRACSSGLTVSEALRMAVRLYIKENAR